MKYHYYISYNEKKDDFWGHVDNGEKNAVPVFTIDSTEEICQYISTGVMEHIDDAEGLTLFLRRQGFIAQEDDVLLSEELLY